MRAFITVFDMTNSNNFKIGFLNKKAKLAPSSKIKTNMEITADLDFIDTSIDSKMFLIICIASLSGFSFLFIVIVICLRKCCSSPKLRVVKQFEPKTEVPARKIPERIPLSALKRKSRLFDPIAT
jgi:hypothetical protein